MDKTLSWEYVLGRPPKKPGGTMLLILLMLFSLMTEVAGESLEDGERKKWGIRHIFFSIIMLIFLVKIKNWIVVEYIKWMFDDKADDFCLELNLGTTLNVPK